MPSFSKNYFEFFSLPPKLVVDGDVLQKRFYELSRQWHPDRFSRKGPDEQAQALEATSILNDGYRTLKDPVTARRIPADGRRFSHRRAAFERRPSRTVGRSI